MKSLIFGSCVLHFWHSFGYRDRRCSKERERFELQLPGFHIYMEILVPCLHALIKEGSRCIWLMQIMIIRHFPTHTLCFWQYINLALPYPSGLSFSQMNLCRRERLYTQKDSTYRITVHQTNSQISDLTNDSTEFLTLAQFLYRIFIGCRNS